MKFMDQTHLYISSTFILERLLDGIAGRFFWEDHWQSICCLKSDFLASRITRFIRMISHYKSNKVTLIKFK